LQVRLPCLGEHGNPVFAVPDMNFITTEINIPNPQTKTFHISEARTILQRNGTPIAAAEGAARITLRLCITNRRMDFEADPAIPQKIPSLFPFHGAVKINVSAGVDEVKRFYNQITALSRFSKRPI